MNRAIHATAAQQRCVGRVDDGVNAQCRNVGDDNLEPRRAELARREAQAEAAALIEHALVGEQLLQFAGLEHLADDIAAADELALDVKLRNGRPVRIGLDAVTQVGGFKNVQALVADPDVIEDLDHLAGKTALRKLRRALHEQHDVVRLHFIVDELLDAHIFFPLGRSPLQHSRQAGPRSTRHCHICSPNRCASKVKWRGAGMRGFDTAATGNPGASRAAA